MIRNFLSAIQFITILPVGRSDTFDPPKIIPYFPLVGMLLGLMLAVFDALALMLWSRPVVAVLDVVFLAAVTGAFHIDGLGDTADGLYGQRPREKALAIMKDSRLGTMGLVAIAAGLAIKWGGIASLDSHRFLFLVLVPAYARCSMLFGMRFLDYGRPEGGTGSDFFKEKLNNADFWGLGIVVVLSCFTGWKMILLNFGFVFLVAVIIIYYKKRMGGITGDMLGAMGEITESFLFLLVSIGGTV